MFRTLRAPLTIQWEVTPNCNLKCFHCYNFWRHDSDFSAQQFNHENARKIVNEIISNNIFRVTITGGEPFLVYKDILPYIAELVEHGIGISINTNLTAVTEDMIIKLKELGITDYLVSFPAPTQELYDTITHSHGLFNKLLSNISMLLKHDGNILANMVVTTLNYGYIYETAKVLNSIGVKKLSVTKAMTPCNSTEFEKFKISYEQFARIPYELFQIKTELGMDVFSVSAYPMCLNISEELKKETGFNKRCLAGKTLCVIDMNCKIRACTAMEDSFEGALSDVWKHDFQKYRNDELLPSDCQNCTKKEVCGGGCKVEAKNKFGVWNSIDPYATPSDSSNMELPKAEFIQPYTLPYNFKFNSQIKSREEDFGGILFLNGVTIPMSKELYNFYMHNKLLPLTYSSFNILDYDDEDLSNLLTYFLSRNIIQVLQ